MIVKGDKVRHTMSLWTGTVMAKRQNRALVKWDHSGLISKHPVTSLEKTLK